MKHLALATAALLSLPLSVQADDLLSGQFELGISRNFGINTFFKRVEGSFATQFDSPFNAQVDLGMSKYEADNSTSPFLTLHLTYAVSDVFEFGVFLSGEDRLGTSYAMTGVEGAYRSEDFRAQAYVAEHKPIQTGLDGMIYGLDLEMDFGRDQQWSALAGGHFADFSASSNDSLYLGLSRQIRDDLEVEARVAQHDGSDTVLSVSARFDLGQGVRFNRRDWFANFPAH